MCASPTPNLPMVMLRRSCSRMARVALCRQMATRLTWRLRRCARQSGRRRLWTSRRLYCEQATVHVDASASVQSQQPLLHPDTCNWPASAASPWNNVQVAAMFSTMLQCFGISYHDHLDCCDLMLEVVWHCATSRRFQRQASTVVDLHCINMPFAVHLKGQGQSISTASTSSRVSMTPTLAQCTSELARHQQHNC